MSTPLQVSRLREPDAACCACPFAALGNIVSVLGLFFFIYAVIGMNLWGAVKHGQYLTRLANFQHVGIALLTLFRMITGESSMAVCGLVDVSHHHRQPQATQQA